MTTRSFISEYVNWNIFYVLQNVSLIFYVYNMHFFWIVWRLYHKIKYSIWLLKLRWIFPSVWTCALMADYFARLIKTWDKPFWHAWPVCSCLMHVFCGQCVIWTKNTIYLSINKLLFFWYFSLSFRQTHQHFVELRDQGNRKKMANEPNVKSFILLIDVKTLPVWSFKIGQHRIVCFSSIQHFS